MEKVVVLLPSGTFFDQVYSVIARCAEEAGRESVRVASNFTEEKPLGRICAAIESSSIVIAEVSHPDLELLYEVGYAHGIGKPVVFVGLQEENFIFDRNKHKLLVYGGDLACLRDLMKSVLSGGEAAVGAKAGESARERFMEIFGAILKEHQHEHRGEVEMEDEKTFVLLNQDMDLALVQNLARRARELGLRIKLM